MVRISLMTIVLAFYATACSKDNINTRSFINGTSEKPQIVFSESAQTPTEFVYTEIPIDDTAYTYSPIKIATNFTCQSVKWKIANDTRIFTNQTLVLSFNDTGRYPVNLIATYYDSSLLKTVTDTVIKILTIVDKNITTMASHKMIGEYKGCNTDSLMDTFTISIRHYYNTAWDAPSVTPFGALTINNLPKGHKPDLRIMSATSTYLPQAGFPTNDHHSFLSFLIDIIPEIKGNAYLKNGGKTITINYSYLDVSNPYDYTRHTKTFIGKKI